MIICEADFSSFAVKLNIISRLTAFCLGICVERCHAPCVFLIFEWPCSRKSLPPASGANRCPSRARVPDGNARRGGG